MLRKKWLPLVVTLIFILSVFLTSCGKTETQTPQQSQEQKTTPTASVQDSSNWIKAKDTSKIPEASKTRTDTIIIGLYEPKGVFNPLYSETSYDNYVNSAMFDNLLDVDFDGTYIPSLAKSWDIDKDNNTITFHLRDDVKFSDGTPLTSKDVEFSYYILSDPTYDGPIALSSAGIKGFKEYNEGNADKIEGIKIIDDHTIQIQLEKVLGTSLSDLNIPVIPQHYYGKDFAKGKLDGVKALEQQPLGSGPYVFEKFVPGQEVRLVANENYWKGTPKIKHLIYKTTTDETAVQMLQTGETDYETSNISAKKDNVELLENLGFVDYSLLPTNGYGYIAFNHKLPKFQDVRVRKALAYGLNRKAIVDAVYQGLAEVRDVPQSKVSWAYPDEKDIIHYDYNPEKAKQLLDEAGWKLGPDGYRYKDGQKFTIHFLASSPNAVNDALVPMAVENYKDLGIEFVAEPLDFNAIIDKVNKGDFEMYFMAWSLTPEPDPYTIFFSKGSQNRIGYATPKVDELILKGREELDMNKRKEIYHELYKVLNDDLPYIFLYQRNDLNAKNARVVGFQISSFRDFTYSLYQAEILAY
ncbi:peptide/nickel transport system substrate-binding protein [Thermoanaerobacter uzonensis DSM 18761]|uniref:Peptide/nickel transport system substrate-binding protein n=1 Tax=Thermoanaerobacter uzonensis DSM 18761 TaxID=1123369 RepID=A0A1M4XEY4_9THEO|nr:ABC transporter substrate-binding protein [Thermoanaerobacter uzonensis]SHE92018.1 peptide/nickel transport system substrate-binding protein [Thermoanaerobacter uzonensis DSM 18761]